jgi:D-sedoheptulose 7-phosphate isomerase
VIVGKRALPALALPNDVSSTLGFAVRDSRSFYARQLATLGGPDDIALGMVHGPADVGIDAVSVAMKQAVSAGMLSIMLGGPGAEFEGAHVFEVPSDDPFIVQEVHETAYHVLWELVHVFFEHKGLLEDRPIGRAHDTGRSSFLYPFLAESESELTPVLQQTRDSIIQKSQDLVAMRDSSLDAGGLVETSRLIAERLRRGAKILTMGNGGSATDAQDLCVDLMAPPEAMQPVAAISLTNDIGVVTAVGNDVGFDNVFARQVIAYGKKDDIAVAISTSGGSRNVLAAVEEGRRRGLFTVGIAGYGGGRLAEMCDRAVVIKGDYIPRIQEAQAPAYHLLRRLLAAQA